MAKVTGLDRAKQRVEMLAGGRGREIVLKVGEALFAAGNLIQVDAQLSITGGSKSGRMARGVRKKLYRASAPGEAPAEDTGDLVRSIVTEQVAPLRVQVRATDRKARLLEYGTSKMGARPFMAPAAARKRKEAAALVRRAVTAALRSAKG